MAVDRVLYPPADDFLGVNTMETVKAYVVREVRTEAGVPVRNSVVRGLTGSASICNGMQLDAEGLREWNASRIALALAPVEITNPDQFLPFMPSP